MRAVRLLGVTACALASACARPTPHDDAPARHEAPVEVAYAAAAAPAVAVASSQPAAPSVSLYDLPVVLRDDAGKPLKLDVFRGHPLLVTMFYGSCQAACPLITADLKRIEAELPPLARSNVRVLMVSFDPERDTPALLHRMKEERGMDAERWTLASAPEDEARELAGVLGIRFRKLDNGQFFHSAAIVSFDGSGHERARIDGLGHDPAPVVATLLTPSI
jgi:protein SCO1/2